MGVVKKIQQLLFGYKSFGILALLAFVIAVIQEPTGKEILLGMDLDQLKAELGVALVAAMRAKLDRSVLGTESQDEKAP